MTLTQTEHDTQVGNTNAYRAAMEQASRHDHEGFEKYLANEVAFINPMSGTTDKAGFRAFHTALWAGIPDINYRVDRTIAEGETVVGQCTVTGTHKGELAGVPASNRQIEVPVVFVVDFVDGKATRWNSYLDTATLMRQIGAMK